jgi:hypothetical protein
MGFCKIAKNYLSDYPASRHTSPHLGFLEKREEKKQDQEKLPK